MRKPDRGKVKLEFTDAEVTEQGLLLLTVTFTHPPERAGETYVLKALPFHEVDELAEARKLCVCWLHEQSFMTAQIAEYITSKEPTDWHALFYNSDGNTIDEAKLEADWHAYWGV
jgi:hypothetical protein